MNSTREIPKSKDPTSKKMLVGEHYRGCGLPCCPGKHFPNRKKFSLLPTLCNIKSGTAGHDCLACVDVAEKGRSQ